MNRTYIIVAIALFLAAGCDKAQPEVPAAEPAPGEGEPVKTPAQPMVDGPDGPRGVADGEVVKISEARYASMRKCVEFLHRRELAAETAQPRDSAVAMLKAGLDGCSEILQAPGCKVGADGEARAGNCRAAYCAVFDDTLDCKRRHNTGDLALAILERAVGARPPDAWVERLLQVGRVWSDLDPALSRKRGSVMRQHPRDLQTAELTPQERLLAETHFALWFILLGGAFASP